MIELGQEVREQVTGFTGVVVGRVEYLSGCEQCLVQPPVKEDGTFADSHWFDEPRLTVTLKPKVTIKGAERDPGPDKPAPMREVCADVGGAPSEPPPTDAAPVEWWHWVDHDGNDKFVRGDKFLNIDATALYAHPEDAPGGPTRVIPNDEIVGRGWVHIERMSKGHIWMNILGEPYDLKAVRGKITWTAQVGWKALNRIEGETDG